ncbi:MAG: helix-turn-helix transcriptional regulator [Oscillospiraceae bacterium]|nr:helix-turn-helix transcriptional regulator [Oscillospiraceae bacterium]
MQTEQIGKNIARLRKERGVKQEELANSVGVSTQAVSKWENGGVPDTALLPGIADFFGISIDVLFGRDFAADGDLRDALRWSITALPREERLRQVFSYCWEMERGLYGEGKIRSDGGLEEQKKNYSKNVQMHSSIRIDSGFTQMGLGHRAEYFLLVPEAEDKEAAYFDETDYPSLFRFLAEKDAFDTCVLLNQRDHRISFTPNLLVKRLGITFERAQEILKGLEKYHMLRTSEIELDDETQVVYTFIPTPSFPAMLLFARELIQPPQSFHYHWEGRSKPYLV